jgi:hypothetical protein
MASVTIGRSSSVSLTWRKDGRAVLRKRNTEIRRVSKSDVRKTTKRDLTREANALAAMGL